MYLISAEGNEKHPRKAVISCIKKNVPNCGIYSTHKNKGTLSYTTNRAVFPNRNWGSAKQNIWRHKPIIAFYKPHIGFSKLIIGFYKLNIHLPKPIMVVSMLNMALYKVFRIS